MITLGIETTCDEMAVAVVEDGIHIKSNVIASQRDFHKKFGGVYPEMAARQHVDLLIPTIQEALERANVTEKEIELIAVSKEPGLIGPLFIGVNAAKTLALAWNKPFLGVNHVEAHLYAAMMSHQVFLFPALGLVLSGGHTFLVRIFDVGKYEIIGTTTDDAIGEAFDKVAALLDLPYPGGPQIEQLALQGDPKKYPFKEGNVKGRPWDFTFSGLKTKVLYTIKGQNGNKKGKSVISEEEKAHVAASFQHVALQTVVQKTLEAEKIFPSKAIYVGGGVSCNQKLRQMLKSLLPVYFPKKDLCLDNAAMIAGLGTKLYNGKSDSFDLEPLPRSRLFTK